MGWRFSKRIKLFGGLGLNLGKNGISMSLRTPLGSIGTKGASIRTGIPGLQYRVPFISKAPPVLAQPASIVLPVKRYKVEMSDGTFKYLSVPEIAYATGRNAEEIEQLYQNAEYVIN